MQPNELTPKRRQFLQSTAGALVGAGRLLGEPSRAAASESHSNKNVDGGPLPPHRPVDLPGIHAYAERSLTAGTTLHVRVSSTHPYQLSFCRLAGDVDDQDSDIVIHSLHNDQPKQQPIHPGSYVHIERNLQGDSLLSAIALECWVRPWRLDAWQGLITQHDFPHACGVGLFLDPQGRAAIYLGDGGTFDGTKLFTGGKLNHRRWNHLAGTWDGQHVHLWLNGRVSGSWDFAAKVQTGRSSLRLAAYGEKGRADHFLEGDLAMPAIYDHARSAEQIQERIADRGLTPPDPEGVIACWPFTEEKGESVQDTANGQRTGRIINHATWMVGGPSFHGDDVGRYDTTYDPTADESRGHGLRFASDDLFDCRWETTHEFQVPVDAKSGLYVGRFDYDVDGQPFQYHVTFNVRRPAARPQPPILVLLSSSTWAAYNAAPFPEAMSGPQSVGTNGRANCHPQAPAYSCYRDHHHGQPAYYFGTNIPWPAAGPDWRYLAPEMLYSHLMRAELFLHRWLDGQYGDHPGYDYDVVTDYDLHINPQMLEGYKTLFINGHSEYWSAEAYDGVDAFLTSGGTVIGLSGNTMFWRTSFSDDGVVMECRKYDPRIGGRGGATIGELYHSDDKQRGSLMRECGMPAWKCIGLECCGWSGATDGVYHTEVPDHFLFREPEDVKLAKGDRIGFARESEYPKSVGHEWDIRLSRLSKMTRTVPPGGAIPAEPDGIVTLAFGRRDGGGTLDYFTASSPSIDRVCAELIYWERPNGGRVFHAGSIAAGSVLSVDPQWQTIFRNALHHFGVSANEA